MSMCERGPYILTLYLDGWVRKGPVYVRLLCVSKSASKQLVLARSPLLASASAGIYLWRLAHPLPPPYTIRINTHTHTLALYTSTASLGFGAVKKVRTERSE